MNNYVYLPQPIDQIKSFTESSILGEAVDRGLGMCKNLVVFTPRRGWRIQDAQPDARLQEINEIILSQCDWLVVQYPAGVPSIGVWKEVEEALRLNIPVLIVTDLQGSWVLEKYKAEGVLVINVQTEVDPAARIAALVSGEEDDA